jgi:hypothetical protein
MVPEPARSVGDFVVTPGSKRNSLAARRKDAARAQRRNASPAKRANARVRADAFVRT